jgi:hypothetical protein
MRARGWSLAVLLALCTSAAAEPKPKPVDIKPIRDQLIVLQDADGGLYVVLPGKDGRIFFGVGGKNKNFYEQTVVSRSADGKAGSWDIAVWAPRVPNIQPGSVQRKADGSFLKWCGNDLQVPLTELSADKAKAIVDKSSFLTTAMTRRPYLLARDDSGVYYYVDALRAEYGGKGFRVFIGKKGAMKLKPLTDIASDTAGDIFATKTGDLRIVRDTSEGKQNVQWVKGEKRASLVTLDLDANSQLIFKDLGVYGFTGSICESM